MVVKMIKIIIKILHNSYSFENCACIILTAVSRVNLPFCHKSMTAVCEVEPQRRVMCIKNKNDKFDYIVYKYMYQKIFCIYKMICLCDDEKRSYIIQIYIYIYYVRNHPVRNGRSPKSPAVYKTIQCNAMQCNAMQCNAMQ